MRLARNLTRVLPAIALAASSCAPSSLSPSSSRLRIVSPDLSRPIVETIPGPAEPQDPVRQAVFARINEDRIAAGLATVAWDEDAARVADAFTKAQVREKTRGHFLTDGLPPYARTALAGVFGMGAENAISWVTTADAFREPAVTLALEGHEQMIAEKPPDDGHRRTILDPDATHVGVGWAMAGGRFQLAQEFLTRRLERLQLEGREGAVVRISGRAIPGWSIQFATAAWEPRLRMTREQATSRSSYSFPSPEIAMVPEGANSTVAISGAPAHDRLRIYSTRDFGLLFAAERPGLWTIVFYFSSATSLGSTPGACVVLEVE
ncbi:MAG TPA: CAP domain-containing protein [Thermoanaerobaculia bacterium]